MSELSSYTRYLPPCLWSHEGDPHQFLGKMLRIFEKILTGIDDDVTVEHASLEATIDALPLLYDPWRTPQEFLSYLASWVGLAPQEGWSEAQKRRLISQMASIYQQRGTKQGLYTYLDVYGASSARPRIAIDDGEALLRMSFLEDGTAELHPVAYSSTYVATVDKAQEDRAILLHPAALAVDSQNRYIVADEGGQESDGKKATYTYKATLWRLSSTGELEYETVNARLLPNPLHHGEPLNQPRAIVVNRMGGYSVLNAGTKPAILHFDPPEYGLSDERIDLSGSVVCPVDMVLNSTGCFVVLDRGEANLEATAKPKIVIITQEQPLKVEPHTLKLIVEPTALVKHTEAAETFIVADAGNQNAADPGDLVRVEPGAGWKETSLLEEIDQNPLIYPTGLVFEAQRSLLVCDTGLRRGFVDEPGNRVRAEPAAVYRVDLSQARPQITRLTRGRTLVSPSKVAIDRQGRTILAERGAARYREVGRPHEWRAHAHEFGIVVHFSHERATEAEVRNRIRREVERIVHEQRPAHTAYWMEY